MTHRTLTYRLHPTPAKARLLAGTSGASRFVWNWAVGLLREQWDVNRHRPAVKGQRKVDYAFFSLGKAFTALRNDPDTAWLQDYSRNNVSYILKAVETAYKNFFKHPGKGLPRFHSRHKIDPSFCLVKGRFRLNGEWLFIEKIGEVKVSRSSPCPYEGKPVSGTVKQVAGKWYAMLVYEVDDKDLPQHGDGIVGIDRNVGQVALSTGQIIRLPDLSDLERKRNRYQRRMARQVKDSARRNAVKLQCRRVTRKMAGIRSNWCHQTSRKIANEHGLVFLEDLKTQQMMKSAKGNAEQPGKNVAQKRGLNRSIAGSGWFQLEQMLSYKTNVKKVPPAYTSMTCHKCGHADKENRKAQADFHCLACGYRGNADINAASNILALGIGVGLERKFKRRRGGTGAARPPCEASKAAA